MDKNTEIKLDSIFKAYQQKADLAQQAQVDKENLESEFLKRFLVHRDDVVGPALESFAIAVEEKGVSCRIDRREDRTARDLQDELASISITFLVGEDGRRRDLQQYPHLAIVCDKREQKVRIHISTMAPGRGGQSGAIGSFLLEQVDASFINEKLLDLLKKILL